MPRPALAATRAVDVLNFLAANPTEAYTLSQLAERLGVNVASMHALLNALTDDGYLVRHPRLKTFALGPAVIALGNAALETHPAVDLARDAARDLAKQTGLEVAVTAPAGDSIVFLARAGVPSAHGVPVHVGQRVPFVPPLGAVFVAWGGEDEWLAKTRNRRTLRAVLESVRGRGYSVALELDTRTKLGQALDELASSPSDDGVRDTVSSLVDELGRRHYHERALDRRGRFDVSMIAAPVFGPSGDVVLAITLLGFPPGLTADEIARDGELVRDAALVVTKRTRGRVPAA